MKAVITLTVTAQRPKVAYLRLQWFDEDKDLMVPMMGSLTVLEPGADILKSIW